MSRPEHLAPPEVFYGAEEALKYTQNTRIISIQQDMAARAIELLNLDDSEQPCMLLDIGCGSGLSGEVLEEDGHVWVGLDVSDSMLKVASDRGTEGDLFLSDIGQGVPFRPGSFDGAISISVIQWLCNADKSHHEPRQRLMRFFNTLYSALGRGARAVFQFYPENPDQVELIVSCATRAGFSGGLVVDYPNSTKAKKYFLVLFAGYKDDRASAASQVVSCSVSQLNTKLPKGLGVDGETPSSIAYASQRVRAKKEGHRKAIKDKDWILKKKELNRKRGKQVAADSKFTARKRRPRF